MPAAVFGSSQAPRPSDTAKYQAWLEKEVHHVLVLLPYYSVFDNLAFKIDGDRVTLLGQVVRPSTKTEAEARVKKIEGVSGVINQIEVLPASPMDDQLRRKLYQNCTGPSILRPHWKSTGSRQSRPFTSSSKTATLHWKALSRASPTRTLRISAPVKLPECFP